MKRILFALSVVTLLVPSLRAEGLTREERDKAVDYLKQTRAGVLAETKGLSPAQWNYKPASNRWSVAEVTEHIAAAEGFLMDLVRDKVMKSPARPAGEDAKSIDDFVMQRVPDRSTKAQAPEPLQPNNRFGSPKESLKHFKESRDNTIKFLKSTKDLRDHALEAPLGKTLDGYEWILLIAAHSERHTRQIAEVKADPNFPKK